MMASAWLTDSCCACPLRVSAHASTRFRAAPPPPPARPPPCVLVAARPARRALFRPRRSITPLRDASDAERTRPRA